MEGVELLQESGFLPVEMKLRQSFRKNLSGFVFLRPESGRLSPLTQLGVSDSSSVGRRRVDREFPTDNVIQVYLF